MASATTTCGLKASGWRIRSPMQRTAGTAAADRTTPKSASSPPSSCTYKGKSRSIPKAVETPSVPKSINTTAERPLLKSPRSTPLSSRATSPPSILRIVREDPNAVLVSCPTKLNDVKYRQIRCIGNEGDSVELRQVRTFRAAARLGYVQSSVSAQVAALERELGVRLFDRLGRRISLTEAGAVMLAYSRELLVLAGEARDAVIDAGVGAGEVTGSLTVSAPETLLTYRLPRLLAIFHERHPKVRLSVHPSAIGRLVGSMRRAVDEGRVDVAFVLDGALGVPGLSIEPLIGEGVTVIAPSDHALAASTSVVPQDLSGEAVLLPEAPESGCAYRGQFERQLGERGVMPPERMEFQSIEAVKQCVAAGMGVSALISVAVEAEIEDGKLAALRWEEPFDVFTQMVWHEKRWKSPALRAFLETAREVITANAGYSTLSPSSGWPAPA